MQKSGENICESISILGRVIEEQTARSTSKPQFFVFLLRLMQIKNYLQYAAILSQLVEHSNALIQASKAKEALKVATKLLSTFSIKKNKKDTFSAWNAALEIMLDKFEHEITNRDPTNLDSSILNKTALLMNSQSNGIIFWKHNPKNNEKYLKKELAKRYGDSFKGKKMHAVWLEDFNIGNIMHMNPVTFRDLEEDQVNFDTILNEEKLVELVLVYSCCLFSIATENRFICHRELETDKKSNELNGPVTNATKNYQLLQNSNFRQRYIPAEQAKSTTSKRSKSSVPS